MRLKIVFFLSNRLQEEPTLTIVSKNSDNIKSFDSSPLNLMLITNPKIDLQAIYISSTWFYKNILNW